MAMQVLARLSICVVLLFGVLLFGVLLFGALPAQAADTPCAVTVKMEGPATQQASMGGSLELKVENLSEAIDKCQLDPNKFVVFLDGHALKGVHPSVTDRTRNTLGFTLSRSSESRTAWGRVIGSPTNL